jgi:hypothetical protein
MLVLRLWREERGGPAVGSKSENGKTAKPSMTSTFGMVRGAGLDTWSLSDRATQRASPVGIAGRNVKGHRRTFNSGAAGAKMVISRSGAIGA